MTHIRERHLGHKLNWAEKVRRRPVLSMGSTTTERKQMPGLAFRDITQTVKRGWDRSRSALCFHDKLPCDLLEGFCFGRKGQFEVFTCSPSEHCFIPIRTASGFYSGPPPGEEPWRDFFDISDKVGHYLVRSKSDNWWQMGDALQQINQKAIKRDAHIWLSCLWSFWFCVFVDLNLQFMDENILPSTINLLTAFSRKVKTTDNMASGSMFAQHAHIHRYSHQLQVYFREDNRICMLC